MLNSNELRKFGSAAQQATSNKTEIINFKMQKIKLIIVLLAMSTAAVLFITQAQAEAS